jgi:hypothetical protein
VAARDDISVLNMNTELDLGTVGCLPAPLRKIVGAYCGVVLQTNLCTYLLCLRPNPCFYQHSYSLPCDCRLRSMHMHHIQSFCCSLLAARCSLPARSAMSRCSRVHFVFAVADDSKCLQWQFNMEELPPIHAGTTIDACDYTGKWYRSQVTEQCFTDKVLVIRGALPCEAPLDPSVLLCV